MKTIVFKKICMKLRNSLEVRQRSRKRASDRGECPKPIKKKSFFDDDTMISIKDTILLMELKMSMKKIM